MSEKGEDIFFLFLNFNEERENNKMTLNLEILDQNKENKQENFECQDKHQEHFQDQDEHQEQIFEKFLSK